ncbi:MAG TPA: hypothetical protein VH599_16320 [Ktedonobacterales bacterium]
MPQRAEGKRQDERALTPTAPIPHHRQTTTQPARKWPPGDCNHNKTWYNQLSPIFWSCQDWGMTRLVLFTLGASTVIGWKCARRLHRKNA